MAIRRVEIKQETVGKGLSEAMVGLAIGPCSITRMTLGEGLKSGRYPVDQTAAVEVTGGKLLYVAGSGDLVVSVNQYNEEGEGVGQFYIDRGHAVEVTSGTRYSLTGTGDVLCVMSGPFDVPFFRQVPLDDDGILF